MAQFGHRCPEGMGQHEQVRPAGTCSWETGVPAAPVMAWYICHTILLSHLIEGITVLGLVGRMMLGRRDILVAGCMQPPIDTPSQWLPR